MNRKRLPFNIFYLFIPLIILLFSCSPVKNVVYFQNLQNDTTLHNIVNNNLELKIRKNDLLSINIISPDPISTPLFNGTQGASSSSGTAAASSTGTGGGYLVDSNGDIFVYKLGTIHVEGLTRNELKQRLEKELNPYLKDAVITIRFSNNRITMLGEVVKPGIVTMPIEQISLLEAIATSGDLTFTGRRDNILVIRETEKGKQFGRLNLSDKSVFNSPFYYLKPDDVVYVEPTVSKIKTTSQSSQYLSYILSGLTILISLFSLLRR
jgi:polysaccharide export outer membrane protein